MAAPRGRPGRLRRALRAAPARALAGRPACPIGARRRRTLDGPGLGPWGLAARWIHVGWVRVHAARERLPPTARIPDRRAGADIRRRARARAPPLRARWSTHEASG